MTRRTRHNLRPGFTLVELLVALTIGSLLVVSAVSATRALTDSRAAVDRRIERSAAARIAMETIVAALRNVRRDPIERQSVIVGHSGGAGRGNDRIDLLVISDRRCRPDGQESDQYEVSFRLEQQVGQRLPTLMCRTDHALDEHPDDGGLVTVVAEGIVGLTFEYLSGEEWQIEWPALSTQPPEAVRVTIRTATFEEDEAGPTAPGVVVLSAVVPLRITQPPGERPDRAPENERPGGPPA